MTRGRGALPSPRWDRIGRVKLILDADISLPGAVDALHLPKTALITDDGALWAVVNVETDDSWGTWVIRADEDGLAHHTLSAADVDDAFSAQTLIDAGGGEVAVALSTGALRVLDRSTAVVADIVMRGEQQLRQADLHLTPSTARGHHQGAFRVRLGSRFGARALVPLQIDVAARSASWGLPLDLDASAYPVDRYGSDDFDGNSGPAAPIIGDVATVGDGILVCTEGSDEFPLRYGMDFFTIDRVGTDGRVTERIHEQAGWKRMPGKHGWYGRITSDGDALVLSPLFSSGEWKGKQRIFRLADRSFDPVTLPRGASKSTVLDIRDGHAWLWDGGSRLLRCEVASEKP